MTVIKPGATIGIIGGGQLGRMAALAAANLGYKTYIYTDSEDGPASQVCDKVIVAPYDDLSAIKKFAKAVDIVTFEFENIPHNSVKELSNNVVVRPSWEILHLSQNRLREKKFMNSIGIGTAPFAEINSADDLQKAFAEIGPKCILKTVEFGYDGKGQFKINKETDLTKLWNEIKIGTGILEGMVDFEMEISVIVARGEDGVSQTYSPSENIHKDGILDTTIAPANIDDDLAKEAREIAVKIAEKTNLVGLIAVEMFVTKDKKLLVNEIAPRPHNSGHWTMDACYTSQFEQFIRAVCGLTLGSCDYHSKAEMKNLIGKDYNLWQKYIYEPNAKIHLYGKNEIREGRKMGHVNLLKKL